MREEGAVQADLVINGDKTTLSDTRLMVALEATWEIEKLCRVLRTLVEPSETGDSYAVRGLSLRVQDLSGIIMSALHDEAAPTDDLAVQLRGREAVAA